MKWITYPLGKPITYVEQINKHFVNYLKLMRASLILLRQDKEDLINKICYRALILFLVLKKKESIISIPEFLRGNKRIVLIDNLNITDPKIHAIFHIVLYRILLQEITSNAKFLKNYWTPKHKKISEKLILPTKSNLDDLSNHLLRNHEVLSELLTKTIINSENPKNFSQLFISKNKDEWEKEGIKSFKIKLNPTEKQLEIFEEWFNATRYLYNRALELVKNGHNVNFIALRDKLVTKDTKKTNIEYINQQKVISDLQKTDNKKQLEIEKVKLRTIAKGLESNKNEYCKEWTLNVPKDIRANSIRDLCKNYNTVFANYRMGNINRINMNYHKRTSNNHCLCIQKNLIKLINTNNVYSIVITPTYLKENKTFKLSKETSKDIKKNNISINNDVRLIRTNGEYFLCIPVEFENNMPIKELKGYCGLDLGIRTYASTFGTNITDYTLDMSGINKIDTKIASMKKRKRKKTRKRKRAFYKLENRKANMITDVHWKLVSSILKDNDIVFLGDIKSHNIVKGNANTTNNRNFNNLKFYQFKQRISYKAKVLGKKIILVPEQYTTQMCSYCGTLNQPEASKVYECSCCKHKYDRDHNSDKNMLVKGLVINGYSLK